MHGYKNLYILSQTGKYVSHGTIGIEKNNCQCVQYLGGLT